MHLSLYDISLLRYLVRAIYRNESVACCTIYRCGNISQERYFTTAIYRKNDISARYRREAPISRRIIVATHRLYVRYIAEISSIYRKNKERYSAIIVCITFAQYCTCTRQTILPVNNFCKLAKQAETIRNYQKQGLVMKKTN